MKKSTTDWTTVKLGDIGEALIGLTYDPSSVKRSGTLVLRSSNIQRDTLVLDDNVYVDTAVPERIRVRNGDILLCARNGSRRLIGKSTMLDERVAGQTFGAFMAVFRSDANAYLRFFFQSDAFRRQIDEHLGATINQITNRSLNNFQVDLPPQDERDAIVERLADADRLIGILEGLIAKKEAIKQGVAQALLTGRTRLPDFANEWTIRRFDEIAKPVTARLDPRLADPGTDLVELEDIESGTGRVRESARRNAVSLKTVFAPGDVLFGKLRAYLRKYWLADRAGLCSTEIWALRPSRLTTSAYVRYIVETDAFIDVASGGHGTHMPRADWGLLRGFEVELPPVDEQTAIALILSDADREIDALRLRLDKAKAIKQGMMQEILTGRTRLPVMESTAA